MVIHGKGYVKATCTAEGDAPSFRLDALDPNYVQVRARTDGVIGLEYIVGGSPIPTVPYSLAMCVKGRAYLVHVPYRVSVAHPEGTTPLVDAAVTLRGHVQTERHASFLFDAGTYTGGVLTTEQDITSDQAAEAAEEWASGATRGKVRVLGNGIKYYNEIPNAVDLQMVETRSFAMSVVYSLLGIPQSIMGSSMMGGQSSLSYSNAQDNERLYARNALRPIGEQITSSLSNLLPHGRNADEAQRIEFDYSAWEGEATDDTPDDGAAPDPRPVDPGTE
jgi:phage portal protein BeeE